jgi:hypothetical protein
MIQPPLLAVSLGLWVAALVPACARSQKIDGLNRPAVPAVRATPRAKGSHTYTHADCERHVRKVRPKIPAGFTVVIEPPFVVLGDEAPERVRQRAVETVRWATTRLKALYFPKDPKRIIEVWLFKDRKSYRKHAKALWNDEPQTPYGYYSDADGVLVMNIATGGGTLVHEMVHPFVESNFPNAPAWLNEGLGSLYEQCGPKNGRIWGFTNWRLAGLQKAIRAGVVPSFKKLSAMSSHQFYEKDQGTNYSQSRYLLFYLQSESKLVPFYKLFHRNRKADPTGYKSLQKILGTTDMVTFKRTWEQYVLTLRFPATN